MRICIFGDSITWGAWDEEMGGWVNRLRLYLEPKFNYEVEVYNLGVSGDTTQDLLKRLEGEIKAINPDIIIFSIGINDSHYHILEGNSKVIYANFEKNLYELFNISKKYCQKIIFLGLTKIDESRTMPVSWGRKAYYSNAMTQKYNEAIRKFCENNQLPYVQLFDVLEDNDLDDGLHPSSQGHQKISEKVKEYLLVHKIIEL